MTKTQVKKRLEMIKEMAADLRMEVEETIDSIEPYEGKDDLTEAQEERLEWLENVRDFLDAIEYDADDYIGG